MCTVWSRRVPRHCMLWKFCVHMGWMTQPSNLSTRQSSSLSWCMAHLRGGSLRVPAINSEFRRSSVVASVAGSLHQIYRRSPTCAVGQWQSVQQHPQQQSPRSTSYSSSTVTGVTILHSVIPKTQPATFYNLYLTHWQKLLTRMLHMDSYWLYEHLILPTTLHFPPF